MHNTSDDRGEMSILVEKNKNENGLMCLSVLAVFISGVVVLLIVVVEDTVADVLADSDW